MRRVGGNMGLEWVGIRIAVGRATQARSGRWLFFFFLVNFYFFKLWKYDNTLTGDLKNTGQSYIWLHYTLLHLFILNSAFLK